MCEMEWRYMNNQFKLAEALKSYKAYNEDETAKLNSFLQFIKNNSNLFSRTNLTGHITGSGFLLKSDLSKVLLTHHAKLNEWLQFGGHSDGEANTLNVAIRETIEESGIRHRTITK